MSADPFADWEWREFPIATTVGIKFAVGWVNDMFGVHKGSGLPTPYWVLTHLPTGLSLSTKAVFPNAEIGVAFANRLRPCRNDWRASNPEDLAASIESHVDLLVHEMGLDRRVGNPHYGSKDRTVTAILGDIYGVAEIEGGE